MNLGLFPQLVAQGCLNYMAVMQGQILTVIGCGHDEDGIANVTMANLNLGRIRSHCMLQDTTHGRGTN